MVPHHRGLLNGVKVVNGLYVGSVWDWLSPFSVIVVLGVVAGYSMLGSTYLIIKTKDDIQASLAAADLVICQTGCISHNAYWRVKDFCKRTGKRCVFVNNPSASSLSKSLSDQLRQIVIHDVTDEAAENDLPPVLTDTSST